MDSVDKSITSLSVKPWKYNPSGWKQRIPICILAGIGTVISAYLSLYQFRLINSVWDPVFGKGTSLVLDSNVSETMKTWMRIPDASLGAFAYLGDAVFGIAGSTLRWLYRPWLVILFGIDVIPLGIVSIILVILQGTLVGHWCFLCLTSALISLVLIIMAYDEVFTSINLLSKVYHNSNKNKRVLWNAFWGRRTKEASLIANQMIRRKENVA